MLRRILTSRLFVAVVCLVCALVADAIVYSVVKHQNFFAMTMTDNVLQGPVMTIMYYASDLAVMAVGVTVVMACTGGVDISGATVFLFSAAVGVRVLGGSQADFLNSGNVNAYAVPLLVGLLVMMVVGAVCGAWNGLLVAKLKVPPLVATMVLYIAARAGAKIVMGWTQVQVNVESFRWAGNYITEGHGTNLVAIPTQVFIAVALLALAVVVVRRTSVGATMAAVRLGAGASGIGDTKRGLTVWLAFVFSGLCAGIAGIIQSSWISTVDTCCSTNVNPWEVVLAVVLGGASLAGGTFSLAGAMIGALTVQSISFGLMTAGVGPSELPFYLGVLLAVVLLVQSPTVRDLFKRRVRRMCGPVLVPEAQMESS